MKKKILENFCLQHQLVIYKVNGGVYKRGYGGTPMGGHISPLPPYQTKVVCRYMGQKNAH
jgi:hypothetical protein